MPPTCYPPEPSFGAGGPAERRVWEALREQLPDGAALFHSLALVDRNQDYEADLMIAWPGVGLAVVEVKGGQVTRVQGQWQQAGRNGTHQIADPVRQAETFKHVLHRHLDQQRSPAAAARAVHMVAFPFTLVPADWATPGCPRAIVIAQADLAHVAERVKAAVETHGTGHRPLTDEELAGLVGLLAGQLTGQLSLLSIAEEHEQRVDQLTRDQLRILGVLRYHRRLKIIGSAGTGKTWLALEQARRLAKDRERVALVCYSRGLARYFERMTAAWVPRERPAYVGLFHAMPLQWGADPPPQGNPAGESDYYERLLPAQLERLAAARPVSERFDSIVVDEAQDFGDAWWPPTLACLRDAETGGLFVFLDEAQRVFSRQGEVPIPLPPHVLDENIRNTKHIAQVFGSLAAEQPKYRGIDGPPVRFVQCPTDAALASADDEVDRLLDTGWEAGQIALLSTGARHPEQVNEVDLGGWAAYWDHFLAEEDVFYGHVLGFKGLERPAVVLAVNGIRDESRAREYLYVGLSRARTQLVVCGDLDVIARIGGEGIRRRLAAVG
ncbi:MAG: NERD domain-containing protein [Actinomycetota bacterium]|nr:NERD domain-containing protein [Actinomycetota bacterium]